MPDVQKTTSEVSFEALRLYSGAALQIQSLADGVPYGVKFIGAIMGKSIMVTLPIANGKGIWVQAAQPYVIRGFTGKHAFAFEAPALKARAHPFPYVHFAYPRTVNSRAVRKSLRVKSSLSASVTPRVGDNSLPVTMVDLSTTGSMVDSLAHFGIVGDVVKLMFSVTFENISANLDISAIVRSIQKPEAGKSLRTGLEFENISYNDNLILRCFVHTIETGAGKFENKARAE
jgi:c-di-GMP-binding flagellar brake protein YcgR